MTKSRKRPENRKCERCGQPKGCVSFRLIRGAEWTRGYFHVQCFRAEIRDQEYQQALVRGGLR